MADVGNPIMSGHCAFPETARPEHSHERCASMGGGSTANPWGIFHPCPDGCHLSQEDRFECGDCGGMVAAALNLPADENGEPWYVHIDPRTGRADYVGCWKE